MKKIHFIIITLIGMIGSSNAQTSVFYTIVDSVKYKLSDDGYGTRYVSAVDCLASSGIVTMPDSITFTECPQSLRGTYPVVSIGEDCFYGIGSENITNIILPNTLKTIEKSAFEGCSGISNITLPNSLTSIDQWAFAETGITAITIPDSITLLKNDCFRDCHNLASITFPPNLRYIGFRCFYRCTSLVSIDAPLAGVVDGIFDNVHFDGESGYVGDGAFEGCTSLQTVRLGGSVGSSAFYGCTNLTTVECNTRTTDVDDYYYGRIGTEAFRKCINLRYLNIGRTTYISSLAFWGGGMNLDTLKVLQENPSNEFCGTGDINLEHTVLVVPCNSMNAYENCYPWNNFWTIVEDCSGDTGGNTEGINDPIPHTTIDVHSIDGRIYIKGADAVLYAIEGRAIGTIRDSQVSQTLPPGVYMVKVGTLPAQKVVVIR